MARGFPWLWVIGGTGIAAVVGWFAYPPFKSLICRTIGKGWASCGVQNRIDPFTDPRVAGSGGSAIQTSPSGEYQFPTTDPFSVKKVSFARSYPTFKRRLPKLKKSR